MDSIKLTKMEAARRQIDAAIRMTFSGEDPVAIHSVTSAANRIVRDLCAAKGDVESYLQFTDWIKLEYEKKFWRLVNESANFLKHADNDADEEHELKVIATDFWIVTTIRWFKGLGGNESVEMQVFTLWWAFQNPKAFKKEFWDRVRGAIPAFDIDHIPNVAKRDRNVVLAAGLGRLRDEKAKRGHANPVDELLTMAQSFR